MSPSSVLSASFSVFFYVFFDPPLLSSVFFVLWLLSSRRSVPGVDDMCHSLWQGDFTRNRKQVVNRLKIPQGLSTLLFHRWSEVSSRGGVRGDSP